MNKTDVIRAWKDPLYRATLSAEQQAALPHHPAGLTELSDDQLRTSGAGEVVTTAPNCTNYTFINLRACCPPITTAINCTQYTFVASSGCGPTTA
jgi:mersacidin/lichenicidin family type 2 lantibiotic